MCWGLPGYQARQFDRWPELEPTMTAMRWEIGAHRYFEHGVRFG